MSDSSLIDRLFELCQQYDHISFIPGTKKPNVEIAKANVVCLPSLYGEGTPKSLIEALAAGKFILCTNIPGARDCVIDGVNGFLLDTNNIKNDLFFALQNLDVFVKSRYREVYKISQNLSERYDVKRVISQYLEFI